MIKVGELKFERKKMINSSEDNFKNIKDLCLPFIKLKDLSEKDIKRRRDHILSRLLDEERIKKDKEFKKQRMLKEKEENLKILSPKNFIWDKDFINLPPICTNGLTSFPKTKRYLTLFDESSYQFPLCESKFKKKDLLLRFNSKATIIEVEKDFHPNYDPDYRRDLEKQIKIKLKSKEENKNLEIKLDKFTIENYPFGNSQSKNNQQNRFPRYKLPIELGELDDKFFPWSASFGKKATTTKRQRFSSDDQIEPIICKTKSGYVKM